MAVTTLPDLVSKDVLHLQILGPLRIWRGNTELDPGPRQQAYLLAMLLALEGRPINRSELIELIWEEDPPASALNVVHKYVGALRRLLEPDLAVRGPGSYLRRRGDGYVFTAAPGALDLVVFRQLVEAARAAAEHQTEVALDRYAEALALWQGPAGDGLPFGSAAMPIFVALNVEFFDACVAATGLALAQGRPERVLPALQLAASMAPLHEPVQAGLVLALGASGRQAEALAVYRAVRTRLAQELGIEPGPELQAAQRRVLTQSAGEGFADDGDGEPEVAVRPSDGTVGREDELATLRKTVNSALRGGARLVVVEGEPGIGKTHLVTEVAAEAELLGAQVVWGTCLDGGGAPSMWPWVKAVGAILDTLPPSVRQQLLAGDLNCLMEVRGDGPPAPPDAGAQFRLFEEIVAVARQAAARQPLVLVIDDLHWADVASLQMFVHLAVRLPAGVAVIGVLRDRAPAPGTDLSRALAAVSRVPGHCRIRLRPMNLAEVAEMVRRGTGYEPGAAVIGSIHARTAGNTFLVQELTRLLDDCGVISDDAATRIKVPATVRDIVRYRTAGLDDEVRRLLQIASLVGRYVGLDLLAHAAGLSTSACFDRMEPLEALGVLASVPGDPFAFRFPHDLVREAVAESIPALRATDLHLRIADAIEQNDLADDSVERLAYHLWAAGPLADPARTSAALVRAGRRATDKSAFGAGEENLLSAVRVARMADLPEAELSAVSALVTIFWGQAGFRGAYDELLERAEHLARTLGREAQAADFLFMRWIVAVSTVQPNAHELGGRLFELANASNDPIVRAYGRQAWSQSLWAHGKTGEAFRLIDTDDWTLEEDRSWRDGYPLRRHLRMFAPRIRAALTTMYGDRDGARALWDSVLKAAGDDPYAVATWAHWVMATAEMAGDPSGTAGVIERWRAVDPDYRFANVGGYLRIGWCWARALAGQDPVGAAAEAEEVLESTLLDPPIYNLPHYYGLIADMHLAASQPDEARATLDRAEELMISQGQLHVEGMLGMLRVRILQACDEPVSRIRRAAQEVLTRAREREEFLTARRAEELLASLDATVDGDPPPSPSPC